MKIEVKRKDASRVELEVEVSPERFKEFEKEAVKEIGQEAEGPGFRKGKMPEEMVKEKMGDKELLTRTARKAIEEIYQKAVSEKGLDPISRPEVEILKLARGNPFCFKASFTVLPEVNLPDYKKIASKVEKKEVSVEEKEVEETLEWLQKSRPELKQVLRPAQKGDFVEIEFTSPQIGRGKKYEDAFILGKGHLVPGFSSNLLGMSAGEEKDFTLALPPDFKIKQAAGKKARFRVRMNKVQETEKREIDDEFAKEVGDFDSLEDLRESIEEGLEQEKEMAEKQRRRKEILDRIVRKCKLEVPEILIEREKNKRMEDLKKRVSQQMGSFERYLEKIEKSEQEVEEALEKEAEQRARRFLVLREIARKEEVEVEKEELEQEMNRILAQFKDAEQAEKRIDPERLKSYTKERIRNDKTLKLLEEF